MDTFVTNTFILMWDPAISSFTMENFERLLEETKDGWWEELGNWSVWDYQKAKAGDRFYMVRVGQGNTGIVMAGYFCSDPYQGEDWSGRGREVHYMDFDVDEVFHSDHVPYITTEMLMNELPGFDWTGGHSGRMLPPDMAKQLEKMQNKFIDSHPELFTSPYASICTLD